VNGDECLFNIYFDICGLLCLIVRHFLGMKQRRELTRIDGQYIATITVLSVWVQLNLGVIMIARREVTRQCYDIA